MNSVGIRFIYLMETQLYKGSLKERNPMSAIRVVEFVEGYMWKYGVKIDVDMFIHYVWYFIKQYRIEDE